MGRILVVDSDEAFARRATTSLADVGHRTIFRVTIEGAVEVLTREHFDVLVVAMRMGKERSVSLVEWTIRMNHPIRFVAVGDGTTVADCRAMLRLGAIDLVPRGVDPEEVVSAVERALESDGGWRCDLHGVALFDHAGPLARQDEPGGPPRMVERLEQRRASSARRRARAERRLGTAVDGGSVSRSSFRPGRASRLDRAAAHRRRDARPLALDATCGAVVRSVDGALACGVVDLDPGIVLGMNGPGGPGVEDETARIGVAVRLLRAARGDRSDAARARDEPIESIHLATDHESQFLRTIHGGRATVVLFTRRGVDVGWGWSQLASWLPVVESVVP